MSIRKTSGICLLLSVLLLAVAPIRPAQARDKITDGKHFPVESMKRSDPDGRIRTHVDPAKSLPTEQAARASHFYKDGRKIKLVQDFGFVAFAFKDPRMALDRKRRLKYYESIKLVVSEIKNRELLDMGLFVLRLVPNAQAAQWDVFTAYMKRSGDLSYVGAVYRMDRSDGLKDLMVTTRRVRLRFASPPDPERLRNVERDFPLRRLPKESRDGEFVYEIHTGDVDPVDLANRMAESGAFASAEPVFQRIEAKPVTREMLKRIRREFEKAAPPDQKKRLPDPQDAPFQ